MAGIHRLAPCRKRTDACLYVKRLYALGQLPQGDALCTDKEDPRRHRFSGGYRDDARHGDADRQSLRADEVYDARRGVLRKALFRAAAFRRAAQHCAAAQAAPAAARESPCRSQRRVQAETKEKSPAYGHGAAASGNTHRSGGAGAHRLENRFSAAVCSAARAGGNHVSRPGYRGGFLLSRAGKDCPGLLRKI